MRHANYGIAAATAILFAFVCQAADPVPAKKDAESLIAPMLEPVPSPAPAVLPAAEPVFVYPPPPTGTAVPVSVPKILRTPEVVYVYPTVPNDSRKTAHGLKVPKGPVRMYWDYVRSPQHQNEPDGTDKPIGGASFWTEFKFAYGSTRQFFGSAEAPPVHRQFFNPELPPGYILRAWQPNRYGRVE